MAPSDGTVIIWKPEVSFRRPLKKVAAREVPGSRFPVLGSGFSIFGGNSKL
jgi:hypothetical protein